jgi:queuine tRNA-ribosyltransferase
MFFQIRQQDRKTRARCGLLTTAHGNVETPVFMPVGTRAAVKAARPDDLKDMGCSIILGNLYHVYLQPGIEVIKQAGGLHRFMNWDRSILTDSGGFQVFSLGGIRKVLQDGVEFRSIIDGSKHFFTPENVIRMQSDIGSDIAMVLDECIPYNQDYEYTREAADRTNRWAAASLEEGSRMQASGMKIFGIVQGGFIRELRRSCAIEISSMDFDGIAFGGLSVGEERGLTMEMLSYSIDHADRTKPLYFMGLGDPGGILEAIGMGIDMFDCVLPTRISRNGSAFTSGGRVNLKNNRFIRDFSPIEDGCSCYACRNFSSAYIRHLVKSREILASMLLTTHNIHFIMDLVKRSRDAIKAGRFDDFKRDFLQEYNKSGKK